MSHDEDTLNITDDEIRESIPCVTFSVPETSVSEAHSLCLPVGYALERGAVWWRGIRLEGMAPGERGAWDHAIAREKARRQREGQVSAADKATAMLGEVIRERDELREKLERVRGLQRWAWEPWDGGPEKDGEGQYVLHADLAAIIGWDGEG